LVAFANAGNTRQQAVARAADELRICPGPMCWCHCCSPSSSMTRLTGCLAAHHGSVRGTRSSSSAAGAATEIGKRVSCSSPCPLGVLHYLCIPGPHLLITNMYSCVSNRVAKHVTVLLSQAHPCDLSNLAAHLLLSCVCFSVGAAL
jgi:hypothetical protein